MDKDSIMNEVLAAPTKIDIIDELYKKEQIAHVEIENIPNIRKISIERTLNELESYDVIRKTPYGFYELTETGKDVSREINDMRKHYRRMNTKQ